MEISLILKANTIILIILSAGLFFFGFQSQAGIKKSWVNYALRLTGESLSVRRRAIRKLRRYPNLKKELVEGFNGENMALALDVVSALRLRSLDKKLLELSKFDVEGFMIVTLNSLIDVSNGKIILNTYKKRLEGGGWKKFSPAAVSAMMIPLSRFGLSFKYKDLEAMLFEGEHELQKTTLSVLRTFLLKHGRISLTPLLKQVNRLIVPELRVQSYFLLSELPKSVELQELKSKICVTEKNSKALKICKSLFTKKNNDSVEEIN